MNRINIITLFVKDLTKSLKFYKAIGFTTPEINESPDIVFFENNGTKLALYPLEDFANETSQDINLNRSGFPGFTLAYNAKTKNEVDNIFNNVAMAGGQTIKKPELVFWGGYSGYFCDLDGNYWEVAYSDDWKFDDKDMLIIE